MEATIGEWQKKDGDYIRQNDVLVVMETDKASMDLVAEHSGQLKILKQNGEDVKVGEVIAEVDTSIRKDTVAGSGASPQAPKPAIATHLSSSSPAFSKMAGKSASMKEEVPKFPSDKVIADLLKNQADNKKDGVYSDAVFNTSSSVQAEPLKKSHVSSMNRTLSPAVRKWITEKNLDPAQIAGTGPNGRITKEDVLSFIKNPQIPQPARSVASASVQYVPAGDILNEQTRKKMSTIRKRIARRLVESQQSTATLTTFNEIDMSQVMSLRAQYKDIFQKKHNIKLGFMGFFIKSAVYALQAFPRVNAFIEEDTIVYNHSCHIGVAVSTDRGLVVPVIHNAHKMGMPELEKAVLFYAEKARGGKIIPDDLMGGTFTISNGGVFGSLMSTPILNPPQSGILGMHKIEQRPVVVDGQIKIKPMMYVALSYDHRVVDGKESVGFLLKIKESVEDPIRLLMSV